MQIKSWTEIAIPHEDVLKGTFKQAEFAADLSRVREGSAGPEYQDPVSFFQRTYITEGMRLLFDSLVKRLSGGAGDPVVQLQTAFGGGKTHTMVGVYHIARGDVPARDLQGVPPILDAAGVTSLPRANIAVIDGNRLSPSQPNFQDGIEIRTLWGEIAWQLGGEEAFSMLADADRDGVSPGKNILISMFKKYGPVVILMDETVAYMRQFEEGRSYPGGSLETNMSFIQALTESLAATENSMMFVSLPESNAELGGDRGQQVLNILEKYFGRIHALWKPVATEEAFEIVRRRLFNPITDEEAVKKVCQEFSKYYQDNSQDFPGEAIEGAYFRRLTASYPIHPEVFDRLYQDWSTMDKFQRTRGVLQLLATVIYRLWKDGNRDPMIMPGSLPLSDSNVKNQSLYYLPPGWDPVVDRDIDGENAKSTEIDTQNSLIGKHQGARRVARTIFLGSAPSVRSQRIRGIDRKHVALGSAHPGISVSVVKDALKKLEDRLQHLNVSDDRYWFDVTPNLRREMEERKTRFSESDDIFPETMARLNKIINRGIFSGVHIFTASGDIPDDLELRLCVLEPRHPHSRTCELAAAKAGEILRMRGNTPRLHQNRLIFLAPDYNTLPRLKDYLRVYLAWKSIVDDVDQGKLVLDVLQVRQARQSMESASGTVNRTVVECYQWLLVPTQYPGRNGQIKKTEWECFRLSTGAANVASEIENRLLQEESVLNVWSPIHLDNMLKQWFWKNGRTDLNTADLWQKMCDYLYLPRLLDKSILKDAIENGVPSGDYFGYADGKEGDEYKGFKFAESASVVIDGSSLIIELDKARELKARKQADTETSGSGHKQPDKPEKEKPGEVPTPHAEQSQGPIRLKKRFYATIGLDPHTGRMQYDEIQKEVISLLSKKPHVSLKIRLDIEAESSKGFDEHTERAVRENCATLNFQNAEFDEE